jgi:hypothetical protein
MSQHFIYILIILTGIALTAVNWGAYSQGLWQAPPHPCMERKKSVKNLKEYGEILRGVGLRAGGGVIELWIRKKEPASFSVLLTLPNGQSCLLHMGGEWLPQTDRSSPIGLSVER